MKTNLGDRMKRYEVTFKTSLPINSYTIIRVDGRAFHTYTKRFEYPFSEILADVMNKTALVLAKNIQGCKVAYVQSDEITLILTDFDKITTVPFFDNEVQKICSTVASKATVAFNKYLYEYYPEYLEGNWAEFDTRVFSVPTLNEAINCLIWRQRDAIKNSISMLASANFSDKVLHKLNGNQKQELLFKEKGINWNDIQTRFKRGGFIAKEKVIKIVDEQYKDKDKTITWVPSVAGKPFSDKGYFIKEVFDFKIVDECPEFSKSKELLKSLIPNNAEGKTE